MEKEKSKKIKIIISIVALILVAALGITYAYFSYTKVGTQNSQVITGNINLYLTEDDEKIIDINQMMPRSTEPDDFLEFTVSGTNEGDQTIYYDVNITHGSTPDITGAVRIDDSFVGITLQKLTGSDPNNANDWTNIVTRESFANFSDGLRLYVDTIAGNSTYSQKYRLYIWINEDVKVYGGELNQLYGDYSLDEWNKMYASVKVKVTGDFKEKTYGINFYKQIFDKDNSKGISDTVVTFSNRSGSDGLTNLYYMNSTASDKYPIYYFRGNYQNNNVVFAGYCWKMVRTTDTGGIKMIYNGTYDATNKCVHASNTSSTTGLGNSAFNSNYKSLAYMG
ncbi:MAG: hypothetical protein IJ565_00850, partial [Bacilli bacterium]|nr:hypothetical protein [Bacilli bacterium]MBR1376351.1 hypothetical protein [Bacilli bacterium]